MTNRDINHIQASFKALNCCRVVVPVENCLWPIPGLQDGPAREYSSQVNPVKETYEPCAGYLKSQQSRALVCHLGLVADGGMAAVVDEGEHALAVVARDELHRNTDAVDVCVTWATSHLKYGFKNKMTQKQHVEWVTQTEDAGSARISS